MDVRFNFCHFLPKITSNSLLKEYWKCQKRGKAHPVTKRPKFKFLLGLYQLQITLQNAWQLEKLGCNHLAIKSSNVVARFFVALVQNVSAVTEIMKCDDDTFVRVDTWSLEKKFDTQLSVPSHFIWAISNSITCPLRNGKSGSYF
ncbi:hypothetical protein NC653_035779 [Populus alba x Populus x berolinensis]|nr:hypothetical protein NC653_035779 [Populus alba x Populus x berolinensis]